MKTICLLTLLLISSLHLALADLTYPDGNKKAIIFSFDDGLVQDHRLVELLNKYNIVGTFNLSSGLLAKDALWLENILGSPGQYIEHGQVPALYGEHEIAAHSYSHPVLTDLNANEAKIEISKDRELLSNIASYPVNSFAYPLGGYNEAVMELVKRAGFTNARTVKNTYSFSLPTDLFEWHPSAHHSDALPFAKEYTKLETDELTVFMVWGHSWEFDQNLPNNNWDYFESLLQILSERDDVWYTTAGQFAAFYNTNL